MLAAVQPATGEDFCLVMPEVSTEVMNTFLAGFSATRAPDEHALMVMDGAGWHRSGDLDVPDNISLVILPAYSPELNPIERIWLYLRERHLSHRLLDSYDDRSCPAAWCRNGAAEQGGLLDQAAIAGGLTARSSLSGAMVSSVM